MKLSTVAMALSLLIAAGCTAPRGQISSDDSTRLRAGLTRADVIRLLGQPDHSMAIEPEETLTYILRRPLEEGRPFKVKLLDGVVQSYEVLELDPARVDPNVATFRQELAVPWYSAQDYARIAALLPPGERDDFIPHADWIERTELVEHEIQNIGYVPMRVPVQAIELESWCRHHGVPLTRAAINAFAEMKLGLVRGRGGNIEAPVDPEANFQLLTGFPANQ